MLVWALHCIHRSLAAIIGLLAFALTLTDTDSTGFQCESFGSLALVSSLNLKLTDTASGLSGYKLASSLARLPAATKAKSGD